MADEIGNRVGNDGAAQEHAATYEWFTKALKWGTVTVAVLLILLAIFLVR